MDTMLLEPELLEHAFHSLAPEDRAEIFSVGAAFYRLNLAKNRNGPSAPAKSNSAVVGTCKPKPTRSWRQPVSCSPRTSM